MEAKYKIIDMTLQQKLFILPIHILSLLKYLYFLRITSVKLEVLYTSLFHKLWLLGLTQIWNKFMVKNQDMIDMFYTLPSRKVKNIADRINKTSLF